MSTTEFANYKFTVKEGEPSSTGMDDAPVWLMCEPIDRELSIVGNNGFLGIKLKNKTKIKEAETIAEYLNKNIKEITYTKF